MSHETEDEYGLERSLTNRHLQLIAIGGAIGTGLFLGSGKAISVAGPSVLLAYIIIGLLIFYVMRALGELLVSDLSYHSFVDFTKEFLGERIAFMLGWTYWLCWIFVALADLTAVGIYWQMWFPETNAVVPGLTFLVVLFAMNMLTVKLFGELEFWFALIKVVAILGLIVVGLYLIITAFAYTADNGEAIKSSFTHLWDRGGLFPKGFGGFMACFQMVTFAFAGIEMLGLTAAETKDPIKNLPKAINAVPVRIMIFYIGSLFVIMCIYPWDIIDPGQSPFVMVFKAAGIGAAAFIVNFVVLTSAASAANSALFTTSRMMYASAMHDDAPRVFKKINKRGIPSATLIFSAVLVGILLLLNVLVPAASELFGYISAVTTVCFTLIWAAIIGSHLVYRKKKPEIAANNVYRAPFYPVANYILLAFIVLTYVLIAMDASTRIGAILTPIWLVILLIAYQLIASRRPAKQ